MSDITNQMSILEKENQETIPAIKSEANLPFKSNSFQRKVKDAFEEEQSQSILSDEDSEKLSLRSKTN